MFKPKIRKLGKFLKFFLGSTFGGITLAPFGIYVAEKYLTNERVINHESIHWKQQLEMLIIFFYLWYILEWIIKLFTATGSAYRALSFEREARENQYNPDYLKTRKPYSWFKHLTR